MRTVKKPKKRMSPKTPKPKMKKSAATAAASNKKTRFFNKSREEDRASIAYDALNSTASGIIITDNEGIIKFVNPAFLNIFNYNDRTEVVGKEAANLFTQKETKQFLDFELFSQRTTDYTDEVIVRRQNGANFQVEISFSNVTDKEGHFVGKMASFIDITERKQAENALRQSQEQLRQLSRKILDAQENERKLVAQEIHDSIGGSLAAIRFALEEKLESMGQNPSPEVISLEKIISQVDQTIQESRRISANLRPSLLDDLGLLATISWFCREFGQVYPNIQIEQQLNVSEDEIHEMLKVVIYRVLQEAMNNMAKHSDATRVRLQLDKRDNRIEFSVADNGCGFDPEEKFSESTVTTGFGLSGMRDRTMLCDGRFEIISEKGKGTTVYISLPCDAESIGGLS